MLCPYNTLLLNVIIAIRVRTVVVHRPTETLADGIFRHPNPKISEKSAASA